MVRELIGKGDVFHPLSFTADDVFNMLSGNNFCIMKINKEQVVWRNRLLSMIKIRDIKRLTSNLIRAVLSFLWRKIAKTNGLKSDDGSYIFMCKAK